MSGVIINVKDNSNPVDISVKEVQKSTNIETPTVQNSTYTEIPGDKYYTDLAKDWAIKMDGKVLNEDFSSKYYAQLAQEYSLVAKTGAVWIKFLASNWEQDGNNYKIVFDGVIAVIGVYKGNPTERSLVNVDTVITNMETTLYNIAPFDGYMLCSKSILESDDYTPATVDTLAAMLATDIIDITGND